MSFEDKPVDFDSLKLTQLGLYSGNVLRNG